MTDIHLLGPISPPTHGREDIGFAHSSVPRAQKSSWHILGSNFSKQINWEQKYIPWKAQVCLSHDWREQSISKGGGSNFSSDKLGTISSYFSTAPAPTPRLFFRTLVRLKRAWIRAKLSALEILVLVLPAIHFCDPGEMIQPLKLINTLCGAPNFRRRRR